MNEIDVYPKPIRQYGALCFRNTPRGPRVLLITTRETRRWMIPKGWPISGLKPRKVGEREAWEEAGVIGKAIKKPFGEFVYDKLMQDGSGARPVVAVFLLEVRRCRKRFPEMAERESVWLTPSEAARRIEEPDLERLLLSLDGWSSAPDDFASSIDRGEFRFRPSRAASSWNMPAQAPRCYPSVIRRRWNELGEVLTLRRRRAHELTAHTGLKAVRQ